MRRDPLALAVLALLGAGCGAGGGPGSGAGIGLRPSPGGDDTAALERAVAASAGTVTIADSGTYLLRGVKIERPNVTIECTGAPAPATLRLRALAVGDGAPILDVRADGFTLRGCILDGNRAAQPPGGFNDSFAGRAFRAGLLVDGPRRRLTVERATFRNVYGAAIAVRGASEITVTGSRFEDDNFEALFADNAIPLGDPQGFLRGLTFAGNTVVRTGSRDPRVNANGLLVHQMAEVRIEDNTWDGFERNAVKLENCRQGTVAGNRIRNGALPNFAGITLQNGAHQLLVRDNDIGQVGAGIDTSQVAGGQRPSDALVDVTIRGNTIRDVRPGELADGIRIQGFGPATTDLTIAGNVIERAPRRGITLRQFRTYHPSPEFSRITIEDNQLTTAGSCGDWFAGSDVPPSGVIDVGNRCQ